MLTACEQLVYRLAYHFCNISQFKLGSVIKIVIGVMSLGTVEEVILQGTPYATICVNLGNLHFSIVVWHQLTVVFRGCPDLHTFFVTVAVHSEFAILCLIIIERKFFTAFPYLLVNKGFDNFCILLRTHPKDVVAVSSMH